MKTNDFDYDDFPVDFQKEIINLSRNLMELSAIRFGLVNPQIHIKGYVGFNLDKETEKLYQDQYAHLDPMHPNRFEETDITVVCSDTMMPEQEWRGSVFYKEYMAPHGYHHDTDVFFRQYGEVIAVLSLCKNDKLGPFNEEEVELLRRLQPFMEYSLNKIYQPKRFSERELFAKNYALTERELDVVEFAMSGCSNKIMASQLNLSLPTVRTHLQHIYDKVGVHSTNELIARLFRELQLK